MLVNLGLDLLFGELADDERYRQRIADFPTNLPITDGYLRVEEKWLARRDIIAARFEKGFKDWSQVWF